MKLTRFDYRLPDELIAQRPLDVRSDSRLLFYDRKTREIHHHYFHDLSCLLEPGSLLVMNNSRVLRARILGRRITGGTAEFFLLQQLEHDRWLALLRPFRKLKLGEFVPLPSGDMIEVLTKADDRGEIRFHSNLDFENFISRNGQLPLPPYIKREQRKNLPQDERWYQTIYAKQEGSLAAPTAGFHFTPKLLHELEKACINRTFITLHVGLGTFQPVRVTDIENHQMETECYYIPAKAASDIKAAKKHSHVVLAVGTTSIRTLESAWKPGYGLPPGPGKTNLFIYPPYDFKVVDGFITNFHLPMTTLFILVCAAIGIDEAKRCYREAVKKRYRFYSYGDAMLVL